LVPFAAILSYMMVMDRWIGLPVRYQRTDRTYVSIILSFDWFLYGEATPCSDSLLFLARLGGAK
jgi:hypothetical protein